MEKKNKQAVVGDRREWRKIVLELTAALQEQAEEGHEYGEKKKKLKVHLSSTCQCM
jgi:hypothetical protein